MNRPRILVVEDNASVSGLMAILLRGLHGMNVECADSVRDATEKFYAFKPDRAVVDIQLPDGSGIDLIHAMKRRRPNMRTVVATGRSDEESRELARMAGADEYLVKPVSSQKLVDSLDIPSNHEEWDDEPSTV